MLNRTPPSNNNTSNVLNSYRKRKQQRGPLLVYGAAALVVIGLIVLGFWLLGSEDKPLSGLFATDTPTPTLTLTATTTATPSITPTITETPTITITPTPTGDLAYTIIEGDTLQGIAEKFNLGDDGVLLILESNPPIMQAGGIYYVGQTITIPEAGTLLKTATPLPANLGRGARIEYQVLPGDTLAGIAAKFNSLEEEIIALNNIENANDLQAGQALEIPVNLVTATATLPSTSTPVTPTVEGQPTQAATAATATGPSPSSTCASTENAAFVTELQTLINNARTTNGQTALSVNQDLADAAKGHATDMLCNNYLSHIGISGSTQVSRVAAQDYTASLVLENIYALPNSTAQTAFNWWMSDPANRANILNANVTEFGIAYVTSEDSLLGNYFVVVFAKP
jgi:uncharacterized protein YkwD